MFNIISQLDFSDIESLIYLIAAIILMAFLLYLTLWLFGEKEKLDLGYFLKLALMALIIVIIILATAAAVGSLNDLYTNLANALGLAQMIPVLAFLICTYAIQYLLVPYNDWKKAIWITFVAFCAFYAFNWFIVQFGAQPLIPEFGA